MKRIIVIFLFSLVLGFALPAARQDLITTAGLTSAENELLALVNGTEAYAYDKHLEDIGFSHYAFRSAGSSGANATADWIAEQFMSLGLDTKKEAFQFTNWDLVSKPTLVIDDDANPSTTSDQTTIQSFQCEHYSWPADLFADLVVLPLPPATQLSEIGSTPIGTLWDTIDTTGKVALIGREVRINSEWHTTFVNKLNAQPPAAVIHTWWYDWMAFVPDFFSSAGGRPVQYGHYFWQLEIPVGFVSYSNGLLIRDREGSVDVSAKVRIEAVIGSGPHYNVVGRLYGFGQPDKSVILMGHYDSVMCGGFCDNGAGTSGVLELAHVFTQAVSRGLYYPKYSIIFIGLASEEIGLVGATHYVAQHKAEMENIIAVINLDCIGSDTFAFTRTYFDHGIFLDQIADGAAEDLGLDAVQEDPGQADEIPFLAPTWGDESLMNWWDTSLNISGAHGIGSSILLSSQPLVYRDYWETGALGWIHTSYDNSTSTETLNWIEVDDFEAHIKVAALIMMRIIPSSSISTDLNKDGTVNIIDITIVAKAFGAKPGDEKWDETADVDKDGQVNIVDISMIAKDFGKPA